MTARGQITCISITHSPLLCCLAILANGRYSFTRAEHAFIHKYSHNSKKWLPKALLNNIKLRPAIQKHLLEYFLSTKSSSFPILQTKSINMRSIQQLFILKLMQPIKKVLVAELNGKISILETESDGILRPVLK